MNIFKPEKKTQVNRRTRKPHLFKKALCLVSILSLIVMQAGVILRPVPIFAEAVPDVPESQPEDAASFILTLMMGMGCGVANSSVVNSLYQTLGSVNIASATASQIDQGLQAVQQAVGFDFSTIFSSTASQATEYINSVGADKVVQIGGGAATAAAASAGSNIAASIATYLNQGVVFPAIGGLTFVGTTVLPATLAVGAGVALGFAIDKARTSLLYYIKNGLTLDTTDNIKSQVPENPYNMVSVQGTDSGAQYIFWSDSIYVIPFAVHVNNSNGRYYIGYLNLANRNWNCYKFYDLSKIGGGFGRINQQVSSRNWYYFQTDYGDELKDINGVNIIVNSTSELQTYLNNYPIGSTPPEQEKKFSPDVVGGNGNQTTEVPSGDDLGMPYISPQFDPTTETMRPIPREVLESWVNDAETNYDNNDQTQQVIDYTTIINNYTYPIDDPGNKPLPSPSPYPTIAPAPDVIPSPQPQPGELPEPTTEEVEALPDALTQPDWKTKFPFCIPFDMATAMNMWTAEREAPYFDFTISFGSFGSYHVILDFNPFNPAAQLLRFLELIFFIVCLALGTHRLLNPGGI